MANEQRQGVSKGDLTWRSSRTPRSLRRLVGWGSDDCFEISTRDGRDIIALLSVIGLACIMCPATVTLVNNPKQRWLNSILGPSAALSVWLCSRPWGANCDRFGIHPPPTLRWYCLGLLLGLLLPFGLLPIWQTVGFPVATLPIGLLPVFYASPVWEETIFRGVLPRALLVIFVRGRPPKREHSILTRVAVLVLSATMFAACHLISYPSGHIWSGLGARYFLDFAISGMLFGIVRMGSGALLPAILMHATTNLVEWMLIFHPY